jgi:beta-glucosidase
MLTRSDFPNDFVWGVAASAYQIEGAVAEGGRSPSIWDTFSHTPGRTFEGHTGDMGSGHYNRFIEDVGIMAELGVNAYRLSLSWSRIIPEGVGEVNAEGIDFYRKLCELLVDNGITPFVTLYHWDLPEILHQRGGWENPESVEWFTEYAIAAKEHLGDLVKVWATFNEPHCTAFLGYSDGVHAPGFTDPGAAYVVAHHLMVAHHRATAAMRTTRPRGDDRLGIVLNLIPAWAEDSSVEAQTAADGVDAIHNRLFASAVLDGEYPDAVLRFMERFGVSGRIDTDLLARVKVPIDYLGVNYYNVNHIGSEEGAPMIGQWPGADDAVLMRPPGHLTDMSWGVEPVALTWMLNRVTRWAPGLPLYVTENGAAYPDVPDASGVVHDDLRREYIEAHIAAMHDAMEEGADVRGYFVWSLLDNFEWSHGYRMRFGIVRVDYDTMERTIKDSGRWYQRFLAGDASIA